MRCDRLRNLASTMGLLALTLNCAFCDVLAWHVAWKKPVLWLLHSPPSTQDLQELWREHHIPIFLSFALLDAQDHALAVDRERCERDGLGDAQACGIAGCQNRAILPAAYAVKKLDDFLWAEDYGQCLGCFRRRNDSFKDPALLKGHLVQEAESRNSKENGLRRQLPFIGQVDLVSTNLFGPQQFR